jgi:hypothetical protein
MLADAIPARIAPLPPSDLRPSNPGPGDRANSARVNGCAGVDRARHRVVGLAVIVDHPTSGVTRFGRLFVPDRHVRWVGLIAPAVGTGRRRESPGRVVLYKTRIRYGMPTIGGQPDLTYHIWRWPNAGALKLGGPRWRPEVLGVIKAMAQETLSGAGTRPPTEWMPKAYLAFPDALRDHLYAWSTPRAIPGGRPYYPPALRRQACEDVGQSLAVHAPVSGTFAGAVPSTDRGGPVLSLVFRSGGQQTVVRVTRRARVHLAPGLAVREGDLVATDGPDLAASGWQRQSFTARWERLLPAAVGRDQFDAWLRTWFDRQLIDLRPGLVHAPADLAAAAAFGRAVDGELYWDLGPAMDYYRESIDAFVFPPFRLRTGRGWRGVLPGEVAFDFASPDPPRLR